MAPSDSFASPQAPLAEAELAGAEALVAEAGWNQTAADWRTFIALGKVHAIRDAGRVIATAATLPYGSRLAWISMVLVAPDYRRRGLATALLRRSIDEMTAAGFVPALDATPDGRAVYRGLGFMDAWGFQRMARRGQGAAPPPAGEVRGPGIRAITDGVWPALCAYDAAAFGADRTGLLTRLRARAPDTALYGEQNGRIAGLLLGREGRIARQIGPLIAESEEIARALLARALAVVDGPVFVDVADAKAGTLAYLAAAGFTPQRPLTRMLYRRATPFDDGTRTFAVAGPEFG